MFALMSDINTQQNKSHVHKTFYLVFINLQTSTRLMYSVMKKCGVWHRSSDESWCWWEHMALEGGHLKSD